MSFTKFNPNGFAAGAIGVALPLAGALIGGAVAGAQGLGEAVAEQRAMSAIERYCEAEKRLVQTQCEATDAEAEQRRSATIFRTMIAQSIQWHARGEGYKG